MCIFLCIRFGFYRIQLKDNERRTTNIKTRCTKICVIFNDTLFRQHYHEQFSQEFRSLQHCFVWSVLILQKLFVHFYLYSWQAAAEINRGFCGIVC